MKPYYQEGDITIYNGDCLEVMKELPDQSVNCCVTSPPYWGLRDYGVKGQLGLEKTPEEYTAKMVEIFRGVHRVLRDDGTLWLNLGDTYAAQRGGTTPPAQTVAGGVNGQGGQKERRGQSEGYNHSRNAAAYGMKHKDLVGIPWRVAFALQADGWYLRQDIIWHKPNPMPESVTDRCTKAHEYIFLLSKSARYYYEGDAIKEQGTLSSMERLSQNTEVQAGSSRIPGKTNGNMKAVGKINKQRGYIRRHAGFNDRWDQMSKLEQCSLMRNKRSVWTVTTKPFSAAHFAVYPPDLIEPCVKAGCPVNGVVLDPFTGSGTTGVVAKDLRRKFVGIELNQKYLGEIAVKRLKNTIKPMF